MFGVMMVVYSFVEWNPVMTLAGIVITFIGFLHITTS